MEKNHLIKKHLKSQRASSIQPNSSFHFDKAYLIVCSSFYHKIVSSHKDFLPSPKDFKLNKVLCRYCADIEAHYIILQQFLYVRACVQWLFTLELQCWIKKLHNYWERPTWKWQFETSLKLRFLVKHIILWSMIQYLQCHKYYFSKKFAGKLK